VSKSFNAITAAIIAGTAGLAAAVMVAGATLILAPGQAEATPQYASQTGRPCATCHVNPAGGGKLKPAGAKFKAKGKL
jgi:hypothetical protein